MLGREVRRTGVVIGVIGLMTMAAAVAATRAQISSGATPAYTADGKLQYPVDYRSWVYLSSGMDMAYVEGAGMAGMSMFDNVFVNPEAYAAFRKTGTWPDKTMLMLEVRKGEQNGSINKKGRFQTGVLGSEIHVKDVARFKGGWAFFTFDGQRPGQLVPQTAACYSCHAEHAAVDTTFVQFYPTLLPIAQDKKTLSPAYLADETAAKLKTVSSPGR